jgi:hypothetical protein
MAFRRLYWQFFSQTHQEDVGSGNDRQLNLLKVCIAHRDRIWSNTQITHKDSRFILVQAIVSYIQSGESVRCITRAQVLVRVWELQAYE